jgi:elongation factor Ts
MTTISASQVKELRDLTGLPMMKCKKALEESQGDVQAAEEALRKQGMKTEGREGRQVTEGAIGSYIHSNKKIGVMLELACETDFVARGDDFQTLIKDICLHIAASNPLCVSREDVASDVVEKEKEIYRAQIADKPENIQEKILVGKMDAFFKQSVLLEQPFVKNDKMTIQEYINTVQMKLGENLKVVRFVRYQLGS